MVDGGWWMVDGGWWIRRFVGGMGLNCFIIWSSYGVLAKNNISAHAAAIARRERLLLLLF